MIKKQLTIANCIRLSLILILTYLIVFSTQALVALIHSNHILINIANKEGSFKFDFVFTTYDSVMLVVCSFILSIVIVYLGEYCYLTFSKSK